MGLFLPSTICVVVRVYKNVLACGLVKRLIAMHRYRMNTIEVYNLTGECLYSGNILQRDNDLSKCLRFFLGLQLIRTLSDLSLFSFDKQISGKYYTKEIYNLTWDFLRSWIVLQRDNDQSKSLRSFLS